jgi:hypothetical protein
MTLYHDGNIQLQARFVSTLLADRLVEYLHRACLTGEDRDFIQ